MPERVVIVGAGQAGCQCALSLRQSKYEGEIILIGQEPHLPYQRPPLSKQILKGDWPAEKCTLRKSDFYETNNISVRTGVAAVSLDAEKNRVILQDGENVEFDYLVICTGSRLNRLSLMDESASGNFYLRTLDDALALRESLVEGTHLAVIGAGYIGLEVAASARSLGCEVSVIESQSHIMKRSALPMIADFLLEKHRAQGVNIHLNCQIESITEGDQQKIIQLSSGERLNADHVLTGIGVRPDLRWLENSGIELGHGIRVDAQCRTNVENILAAGDCAETRHPFYTDHVVLESVQNAVDQGKIAAATILGQGSAYENAPWFWSEQFDCRFQMAGLPKDGDEIIRREAPEGSLSILSIGKDRLNAIQCINHPRDYMSGRKLIDLCEQVEVAQLHDPAADLKTLIA